MVQKRQFVALQGVHSGKNGSIFRGGDLTRKAGEYDRSTDSLEIEDLVF